MLSKLVSTARTFGEKEFRTRLWAFLQSVSKSTYEESLPEFGADRSPEVRTSAERLLDQAGVLDAAAFVKSIEESLVCHSIEVTSRDFHTMRDIILRTLNSDTVPHDRGFVYVSRQELPPPSWDRFLYVGKGRRYSKGSNRLDTKTHGMLASSLATATILDLFFPEDFDDCGWLEGSVMELVRYATGRLPELNTKPESPPQGPGTERLICVAEYLHAAAQQVDE